MKKKLLVVFLCLFSAILFCGCGSVSYILQVESSGVVTQAVVLKFSQTAIQNAGKTLADFQNHVQYVGNQVVHNSISNFESSHNLTDEMTTYSGDTVSFASIVSFTLENIDPQNGKPKYEWEKNGDEITCTITLRFLNIYAYYYFHDIYPDTPEDDSNKSIQDHAFYLKKITESKSPFFDLQNNDVAQYFLSYFGTDKFTLSDMDYAFCYSTTDDKLYGDTSYTYTSSNGNKVLVWEYSATDLAKENGGMFHTYKIGIKAYLWYMLAIIISLGVAVVLTMYCIKKDKKKLQNQNIDNSNNFDEQNVGK